MAEYNSQVMLVTGIQGSGKTLSTIVRVKEWAEKTKRKVFYARIKDLTLDWESVDPDKWYEVPDGSIVVVDEAQKGEFSKDWKPAQGALRVVNGDAPTLKTARAVTELETLRHRGINLVLISQHPMLLHPNVRRLCGLHYHVSRTFGMQQAMIFEWHVVQAAPETPGAKSSAIKHVFKYPKWAYELYKSAEVHTIKRRIPMKVKLILCIPIVIAILGYFAYQKIIVDRLGANKQIEKLTGVAPGQSSAGKLSYGDGRPGVTQTPAQYLEQRAPRIAALPSSAPIYDKLMEPRIAPKPVACVHSATRCSCYTQQGTKMPMVPDMTCRSIVENGYFDDAPDRIDQERANRNASLVNAAAPPATQATPVLIEGGGGQAMAFGKREGAWLADAGIRQAVTPPPSRNKNGGQNSANPQQAQTP